MRGGVELRFLEVLEGLVERLVQELLDGIGGFLLQVAHQDLSLRKVVGYDSGNFFR